MAELFVTPLVSLLIENLAPLAMSFIPSDGIDRKLKQWTDMLVMIQAVLKDAEDRQLKERPIKLWLKDVQKLAFEIDDVVDDLVTEAARRQMITTPESSGSRGLHKFASRFSPTGFNYDMDHQIGEISNRLQELEERKNVLGLQLYVRGQSERTGDLRLPLTSSSMVPTHVFGREDESTAIIRGLLQDRASDHDGQLRIISIVGMGGIGKTTLAQSLYNEKGVKNSFRYRAWVCVTEEFDVHMISKIIYENVYEQPCALNELNEVQEKLRKKLSKKKFLLVFDDVWNEDYEKWDLLSAPLRVGAPGSTIIVTARSQNVANIMGSKEIYDLKVLSDRDCLSLLAQHAFERPNFDGHPKFNEVGEVIAKRCKGLPLAARSLGRLLRSKRSPDQWIEVSTSRIWELQSNDIIPALRLSYHHLPPYLKPLFAYCSLFPKGYEFDKQELIMLWMAQGFLGKFEGLKQMEELGCEYFSELLSRSLFQRSTRNESRFIMHDLNNDLARYVAGSTCLRLDREMESNEHKVFVFEEARHASFISSDEDDDFKIIKAFTAARSLRTILRIWDNTSGFSHRRHPVLKARLPCLRALSFRGYLINELPKSIGKLHHLRYLDLSGTNIKELPEFICDLSNLQTLLLHDCWVLVRLPTSIQKLINLRHLDISRTRSLKEMPFGIGLLTHLRTLSKFIIDKSKGGEISQLKNLNHLQKTLSLIGMENVLNIQDALRANLSSKEGLHGLEIEWSRSSVRTRDSALEFEVLDALKPHIGLTSLRIESYGGQKFPGWIGDRLFFYMVRVELVGCNNCENLPPLGQLSSLKELVVRGMNGVKIVGPEFFGTNVVTFQSLVKLRFRDMGSWEEWCADSTNRAFPCLECLEMWGCMKLNKVSLAKIPTLESLHISGSSEMVLKSIAGVGSVKKFWVRNISGLSILDEEIIGCLGEVEDLKVYQCEELRYLWVEVACQVLEKLKSLDVYKCEELESLGQEFCSQLLPQNLESLELGYCDKVKKMPYWRNNLTTPKRLRIHGCKKLKDLEVERSSSGTRIEQDKFSNNHDGKVRIISIVGMGGIGKTTMAQTLYNDVQVQVCFSCRGWVCVTPDFDVFSISKAIYENVYRKGCKFTDLNIIQQKLREKLSSKKFLLVLDDVWNEDYGKWDLLCAPFHGGAPESAIIVTTRRQDVANITGSKEVYDLKVLSDRDSEAIEAWLQEAER